jgi:hypothetical protein
VLSGLVGAAVFAMDYEDYAANATTPIYSIGSDFLSQWYVHFDFYYFYDDFIVKFNEH